MVFMSNLISFIYLHSFIYIFTFPNIIPSLDELQGLGKTCKHLGAKWWRFTWQTADLYCIYDSHMIWGLFTSCECIVFSTIWWLRKHLSYRIYYSYILVHDGWSRDISMAKRIYCDKTDVTVSHDWSFSLLILSSPSVGIVTPPQ